MEHAEKIKMLGETGIDFQEVESSARSLDIARNSSIDLASLNNKIVKMRSTVRQAKVRVIHKLTRNMEMLKKKKGTEKQLEKLKGKQERLLEEIRVIKSVNLDKVSKYALWNTATLDEICKEPKSNIQSRALTRLAECSIIQNKVQEFRSCHSDWKSLAAYLVMKQSGRRYKKKKNRSVKSSEAESTNIKARHVMTDTYLQQKLVNSAPDRSQIGNMEQNSHLYSERVTEVQEREVNKSPNDEKDKHVISQLTKFKDESQEMNNSNSCRIKSDCLTQRLLKFFPDKMAESSSSDSEDSKSVNNAASKQKSLTKISRQVDTDTDSEDEHRNAKSAKDENVIPKMKPGIIGKRESNIRGAGKSVCSTHSDKNKNVCVKNPVSNTQSDLLITETAYTDTDNDSNDEINSGKLAKKGQRKCADDSSDGDSEQDKKWHFRDKHGSDEMMDSAVGKTCSKNSKIIPASKTNSESEDETSEEDDSQEDDSQSESGSDNISDDGEESDEDDDDMAKVCVKKQQMKQTELKYRAHIPSTDSVGNEMLIKRLDMETFSGNIDDEETSVGEDLPGFLIGESQERSLKKRKNDPFFISSDIEDEGESNKGDNSSSSELEDQRGVSDDELAGHEHIQKARHAFKSDFVNKLGSKGYRRYDWTRRGESGHVRGESRQVRGRSTKRGTMSRGGGRYPDNRNKQRSGFDEHKHSSRSPWQKEQSNVDSQNRQRSQVQPDRKDSHPNRRGHPEPNEPTTVLHPSWEASKKRKEQATIHAFQGKKIKFDD